MVELIEYALALAVSSIFAGASVAVFNSYNGSSRVIDTGAALTSLMDLITEAEADGSSHSTLVFPSSVISCSSETLTVVSSGVNASNRIGLPCDFWMEIPAGIHDFTVTIGGAGLAIRVT